MLVLASLQVLAQARTGRQTLILPLTSTGTGTRLNVNKMAQVFTSGGRPSQCLAPIVVNRVDGENRLVPAQGFLIEPGVHTINGKAILDMTNCPLIDSNPIISPADDLAVDFEPGATYHIGYFHAPANTGEWKLVVWHLEKSPQN